MSGIEGKDQAVRGIAPPLPLPPGTDAQIGELGLALARALVPGAARGPEELARILIELGRLPGAAQSVVLAALAKGQAEANPVESVRARIAAAFPPGTERRHRLAEQLALRNGLDPARLSRTALESVITQTLAKIAPIKPTPRPPIQDVLEPSQSFGPFVAPPDTPASSAAAQAVATAPPPLPPPVAPYFQPAPVQVEEPPAPAPPPPPVWVPPPPRKKKKGLFGKIAGFFKSVFKLAIGYDIVKKVWNKVKKYVKQLLPYIAMILRIIPLGWTQILATVIQIYLAVKAKNIMGIVAAVASFIPAVGAYVGSTAMNAAAQVASKVAEIAKYASQAMDAYSKIKKGDWLGGLAGIAGAAAGAVGNISEEAASTLKDWSKNLETWGDRLSSGMQAINAARRGDFLGAFGVGANLAADLELLPTEDASSLMKVAGVATKVGAIQTALRSGNWTDAADALVGLADKIEQPELKTVASTVQKLVTVQQMVKKKDYLGAAAIVLRVAGQLPQQSVETKASLQQMAGRLQAAGQAMARGRSGDFGEAAKELWKLGLSIEWDKDTREGLQKAAKTFTRGLAVHDALKSGDLSKATELLGDVAALYSEEAATPEALKKLARRLQDSAELRDAIRKGDHSKAADILGEILQRETTGDAGSGGGGQQDTQGDTEDGGGSDRGAAAQFVRTAFTSATEEQERSAPPRRSLDAAVEEVIGLLNAWTRTPEERRILQIIRELPDSEINAFLTELKVRGYLQKLFDDVHGAEYQELLRVLAAKGGRADLDESALIQVLQGILGGGAQFGRDFVDAIAALFKLETYVGMADLGMTLFVASDPTGVFRLFAPKVRDQAIEKLKQVLFSARDKIKEEWQAAKQQGKEAELVARWSTQGILELATFFVGVGEVKTVLNATRLGAELAKISTALSRALQAVQKVGDWNRVRAVLQEINPAKAERIADALQRLERQGQVPEDLLAGLSQAELDELTRRLAGVAVVDDFASVIQRLKTIELQPAFVGENLPRGNKPPFQGSIVRYLSEAERAPYRLTVKDGKLYDAAGRLFDTRGAETVHSGGGRAIFIMDRDGSIYASTYQEVGKFHHSSLAAGRPVTAAGELEVVNGVLRLITNQSGHYRPLAAFNEQALEVLKASGVDISRVVRNNVR